jgi:hypothetical protein
VVPAGGGEGRERLVFVHGRGCPHRRTCGSRFFDDAEDFARHDVLGAAEDRRSYDVPVWIDVGRKEPFARADAALADRMRQYLRFYSRACA